MKKLDNYRIREQYILFDDIGILKQGSFDECIDIISDWTKSTSAKQLYSFKELSTIQNYFKNLDKSEINETEDINFFGFTLKKIKKIKE